jgi:ADP-ribosylglycohydrolase
LRVNRADRIRGVLLGTAIGDALGLPFEGMKGGAIERHYGALDRFRMLGGIGIVSDDTEQTALVAQCLARHPRDRAKFIRAFRFALLGWFLRLPWGIGYATLRACVRIGLGFTRSGVRSAGNGAAMRAAIVGAFFCDAPEERRAWSDALAEVTHTDARATEAARFVAELAALAMTTGERESLARDALRVVENEQLRNALERAIDLGVSDVDWHAAAKEIGTSGFVIHSVPLATFAFVRFGRDPMEAMTAAVRAGGDTDSNAAIVGAWMGALHGVSAFPPRLVERIQPGPFGRAHLERLASALETARASPHAEGYFWPLALVRNLALFPVVLVHAFKVLILR